MYISVSIYSLLVYSNTIDFCMLIMYSATLLNLLIRSRFFCLFVSFKLIWIFYIDNHVFAKKVSFISFLPVWMLLIFFPCLIAMARHSRTMFNKSGWSRNPGLLLNIRKKAFSFSPLSKMLSIVLILNALYQIKDFFIFLFFSDSV